MEFQGFLFTLREISVRTARATACCRLSDGTLEAISNATVSMVSKSLEKASRTLYKGRRGFKEGGNRIVAIANINT